MAADLIIYGIIAAALVFWLKNLLGTRNGEERERDNPFAPKNDNAPGPGPATPGFDMPSMPTSLSRGGPDPLKISKTTLANRVKIETPGAEAGLRAVAEKMPGFTLENFLDGAEYAFELIVTSFAKGDRAALKPLLSPGVYNDFDRAIADRTARGETVDTKIESVRGLDVIAAGVTGALAYISVRFTAQETCIIRNAAGAVVAGAPDQTTTMIDIWTFGREVGSTDPTWVLYETRDERAEPHKTPMPESGG
jgi:predicted lipid-binding transport protein (Tim44 family)